MSVVTTETREIFASKVESNREGIWSERFAQIEGYREVIFRKPVPMALIARYSKFALRRATFKDLEDGSIFAEIPGFDGVWANDESVAEALETLEGVVYDWVLLKIADGDDDLPVLCDIDLNSL